MSRASREGGTRRALTRGVPESLARCTLTHIGRSAIDIGRARAQHAEYEAALESHGWAVERVRAAADQPDSVFIEDTAVVFDEIAIVTRPGASSRQRETGEIAAVLERYRRVVQIEAPGTLDGGDVLQVGPEVYVGMSGRSNAEGLRQLAAAVSPYGYRVHGIATRGCLHLKSAATCATDRLVVINPAWLDADQIAGVERVEVDPAEPFAANVVRLGEAVLVAASAPRTRARLESRGVDTVAIDLSELAKAEGALTCCSILLER